MKLNGIRDLDEEAWNEASFLLTFEALGLVLESDVQY
jgi:hypothetical protein